MNKHIFYFVLLCLNIFLIACTSSEKKEYYQNGNLKSITRYNDNILHGLYEEFYDNGEIKRRIFFENGKKQDTSYYYYNQNGKYSISKYLWKNDTAYYQLNFDRKGALTNEGHLKSFNIKNDKWKFYDKDGFLKEIHEYKFVNNKSYLNQVWRLDRDMDTIGGNYYTLEKNIVKNNVLRFYFFLDEPFLNPDSELYVLIPKQNELEKNISNDANFDTIDNLSKRFRNQDKYSDRKYDVIFDIDLNDYQEDYLRGILLEKSTNQIDSLDFVTREIYFDIPIRK